MPRYTVDLKLIINNIDLFENALVIENGNLEIDESVANHFIQILFMLRENYYICNTWQPFTKQMLTNIVNNDIAFVYKQNQETFSQSFINDFYNKIDDFLHTFCNYE